MVWMYELTSVISMSYAHDNSRYKHGEVVCEPIIFSGYQINNHESSPKHPAGCPRSRVSDYAMKRLWLHVPSPSLLKSCAQQSTAASSQL